MIGVMLLFVGSVLLVNGMGGLGKVDTRSMAVLNFMVAGLGICASLLQLIRADTPADFFAVGALLLFTFTYLYLAICLWLELDMRGFGWFCLFVAITAVPYALMSFSGGDFRFGTFWLIWGALWFMFYLSNVVGKDFGVVLPYTVVSAGILTCWIPGLMILTDHW